MPQRRLDPTGVCADLRADPLRLLAIIRQGASQGLPHHPPVYPVLPCQPLHPFAALEIAAHLRLQIHFRAPFPVHALALCPLSGLFKGRPNQAIKGREARGLTHYATLTWLSLVYRGGAFFHLSENSGVKGSWIVPIRAMEGAELTLRVIQPVGSIHVNDGFSEINLEHYWVKPERAWK